MTQNENELLITDLSAKFPYGVKISIPDLWTNEKNVEVLNEIFKGDDGKYRVNDSGILIKYVKPYLFPLSSMTNEQRNELKKYTCPDGTGYFKEDHLCCPINHVGEQIPFIFMSKIIEWLDKNHFDYRGLIPMGLAIDATNLNIY